MHVAIIGGGVAGCAAAHHLGRLGHHVTIFESQAHIGGRVHTMREGRFAMESGGDTVLSSYVATRDLMEDAGLGSLLRRFDHQSSVYDRDSHHVIRAGAPGCYATTPLLSVNDKLRLATGYVRAWLEKPARAFEDFDAHRVQDMGSIAEWTQEHLGPAALKFIVRPSLESRWYFSCDDMPAAIMLDLVRRAIFVRFFCVAGGMTSMLTLLTHSAETRLNAQVERVETVGREAHVYTSDGISPADGVIIATDAHSAAALLPQHYRSPLSQVRYSQSVRVFIGFERDPWVGHVPTSITPIARNSPVATISLASHKSSGLVPDGCQVVAVHLSAGASGRCSDLQAIAFSRDAVRCLLPDTDEPPVFVRVTRWRRALPVSEVRLLAQLQAIRDHMPRSLRLAGDYFSLASIESAVRSGQRAARDLHMHLTGKTVI